MPEFYICRTFLPDNQEAVAYGVKDSPDDFLASKSIVRIQQKEAKESVQEFEIAGEEIATMHSIRKNKFLAMSTDGGSKVFIYDLQNKKMDEGLSFPSHVQSLATTDESLIVGAGGSLYLYDASLRLHQTLKVGDVVSGLIATDRLILCDIFTKSEDRSQVKLFENRSGQFLRDIGDPRQRVKIKNCFLGILDERTLFTAIPKQFTCDIYIYDSDTGKQRNYFEINNGDALFVFALLNGGIAVCCDKNAKNTVQVYNALDSTLLFSGSSELALRFKEDMILFVASREKKALPALAKGITDILRTQGLLQVRPLKLIQDYAISYQALDPATADELLQNSRPEEERGLSPI